MDEFVKRPQLREVLVVDFRAFRRIDADEATASLNFGEGLPQYIFMLKDRDFLHAINVIAKLSAF